MNIKQFFSILLTINIFAVAVVAQIASGGQFTLTQTVVANGGGASSDTNSGFKIEGTTAQAAAGKNNSGASFTVKNGFWTNIFAPTAATVSVGGRVLASDGRGIRNAVVTLTEPNGATRRILTGGFGYYNFEELTAGQTYIFTASSKRFQFLQPTRILFVSENLSDVDFIAEPF